MSRLEPPPAWRFFFGAGEDGDFLHKKNGMSFTSKMVILLANMVNLLAKIMILLAKNCVLTSKNG